MSKPNVTAEMLLKKYSVKEDRAELAGLVGVAEALEMCMLLLHVHVAPISGPPMRCLRFRSLIWKAQGLKVSGKMHFHRP